MMLNIVNNSISNIGVSILIDSIIFLILFLMIKGENPFWKNLLTYIVGFIIKLMIVLGGITLPIFIVSIFVYGIIGTIVIWILNKTIDIVSPIWVVIFSVFVNEMIVFLLSLIL